MRILLLHNRYLFRGGEDASFESEASLLRDQGHEVEEYIQDNKKIASISTVEAGLRTSWSRRDFKQLRTLISIKRPDVMHIHNSFPLISPAAYYAAKAEGIPIVQTLHNYRLLCPSAILFRSNQVCEECIGKSVPWPGIYHKCYKQSRLASMSVAIMLSVHRFIKTYKNNVNRYIALSEFAVDKFIEGGLPREKIVIKPNFVHPDPGYEKSSGDFALYIGRLVEEKGLSVLLEAWKRLGKRYPLKIAGDGPMQAEVAEAAERIDGVEILGRIPPEQVYDLMRASAFLVFPSIWYEVLPRTIVEAFSVGRPVVCSRMGAMTSLIHHRRNGLHFTPGDLEDLADKIRWCFNNPHMIKDMGGEARLEFETKYTAERCYEMIMNIYRHAGEDRSLQPSLF